MTLRVCRLPIVVALALTFCANAQLSHAGNPKRHDRHAVRSASAVSPSLRAPFGAPGTNHLSARITRPDVLQEAVPLPWRSLLPFSSVCPPAHGLRAGAAPQGYFEPVWSSHVMSEQSPSSEVADAMAVDAAGNLYATGFAGKKPYGTDYFTVKYSPEGNPLWTVRYPGDVLGDNQATAIAVDSLGNVYITGTSMGTLSMDVATIKYNALGVQQWIQRYEGPAQSFDAGVAIGLDSARNVHVAAAATAEDGRLDFLVLKYSNDGDPIWVARHVHQGLGDYPSAMVVGRRGYVAVTGVSVNSDTTQSILTLLYRPDGEEAWHTDFSGPVKEGALSSSIAFDIEGNICVAGASYGWGTESDLIVLRYSGLGSLQWMARYDGPLHGEDEGDRLVTDATGNVIVAGYTENAPNNRDFLVVKYNRLGIQQWASWYNGPDDGDDRAEGLLVDASGGIYASGRSYKAGTGGAYTTVKYDSNGTQQWAAAPVPAESEFSYFSGSGWGKAGNIYLAGYAYSKASNFDIALMRLDANTTLGWEVRIDGRGTSEDDLQDAALDAQGNLYLTGTSVRPDGHETIITAKLNSDGVEQWRTTYSAPADSYDTPVAIAVDSYGFVYVAGMSLGTGTGLDYVTLKYDPANGNVLWATRYDGPMSGDDWPVAMALDEIGSVYVTGTSVGPSGTGYATVRIAQRDGRHLWTARFDGSQLGAYAEAIVLDKSGGINVTGTAAGPDGTDDFVTAKYDETSAEKWVAWLASTTPQDDISRSIAADSTGSVYVTGYTVLADSSGPWGTRATTVKYNSIGAEEWRTGYSGPAGTSSAGLRIALDHLGNIYVAGFAELMGTLDDYLVVKYNAAGIPEWDRTFDASNGSIDGIAGITLDTDGNAYLTGTALELFPGVGYRIALAKYDPDGLLLGSVLVDGASGSSVGARTLARDPAGDLIATGRSFGYDWSIMSAYKFRETGTDARDDARLIPQVVTLEECFPNPFNASTVIRYGVPHESLVSLTVYDLLGREVGVLVNGRKSPGRHTLAFDASHLASGVYLYTLRAGETVVTKKMVLAK